MSTDDEVMGATGAALVRKVADLTTHVVEWVLGDRSAQRASDVCAYLRDIERAVTGEARPCGTTHHLGCACHEAAHRARVEALEAEVARLRKSPASATLSAHDHVRELVAERDEARARAAEHHRRGDEARHEAAGLRRRVAELEAETAQAMAKRDTAMRERIDARADFAASEECLANIVRVWMDADGTRQGEAALAIPMLRKVIEETRKGRTGEWWRR